MLNEISPLAPLMSVLHVLLISLIQGTLARNQPADCHSDPLLQCGHQSHHQKCAFVHYRFVPCNLLKDHKDHQPATDDR